MIKNYKIIFEKIKDKTELFQLEKVDKLEEKNLD